MRRYVILTHDHPHLHWDLMVEIDGALRTWRLAAPPVPNVEVRAEALGDHRLAYLDYEGPVSGGRGHVSRWDAGIVDEMCSQSDTVRLMVVGQKLSGELILRVTTDGGFHCRYSPGKPV